MLKNYFKQNKIFKTLNIIGLAVVLTAVLFIYLFLNREFSFDRFNRNADRIYSVTERMTSGKNHRDIAMAPAPLGPILKKKVSSIENFAQLYPVRATFKKFLIRIQKKSDFVSDVYYATPSLFQIFSIPLIYGDPATGLTKPETVFISQKVSHKFFGNSNPIGKNLVLNNRQSYKITGVFKNLPSNSSLQLQVVLSDASLSYSVKNYWNNRSYLFLLLKKHSDIQNVQKQIRKIAKPHLRKRYVNITSSVSLMPLHKIHLHSGNLLMKLSNPGELRFVIFFAGVAIFLLLIGLLNYLLISTTQINKHNEPNTDDSKRTNVFSKYLVITGFDILIALIIAILITVFLLPEFNYLTDHSLSISGLFTGFGFLTIIAIWVVLSVISALVIMRIRISQKQLNRKQKGLLRSIFVIFEIGTSVALIICTLIFHHQMKFIHASYPTTPKSEVLIIPRHGSITNSYPDFKSELLTDANIQHITTTSFTPGTPDMGVIIGPKEIQNTTLKKKVHVPLFPSDNSFVKTFDLKIIKGRDFSSGDPLQPDQTILVNEAAVKKFGWKHPIGKHVKMFGKSHDVIGVVNNFHFSSLRQSVSPLIILWVNKPSYFVAIRINKKDAQQTINHIREIWNDFSSNIPMEYSTLKQHFNQLYQFDRVLSHLFYMFAFIMTFIAFIGIFGLSAFFINQNILTSKSLSEEFKNNLLSKFLTLTGISFLIGIPVGWFISDQWLQNFAYRIHIHIGAFLLAAVFELILILIPVALSSITLNSKKIT
ncbi:MAG TPA: ABC transporter permease [Balneolales bacterium]|nr:ABC transporter permease [Balneolales bacterium]